MSDRSPLALASLVTLVAPRSTLVWKSSVGLSRSCQRVLLGHVDLRETLGKPNLQTQTHSTI